MGLNIFDAYSLLHFASGIIAFFWGLPIIWWYIIHAIYEYFENTTYGMKLINKIPYYPMGKTEQDSYENIIGDQISALIGWITSFIVFHYKSN